MVTAAIKALPVRSCVIDGEVIACDGNGLADFELLRSRRHDDPAILCAFDLLERDGRDLRYGPIEERKADLAWRPAAGFFFSPLARGTIGHPKVARFSRGA